MSPSCFDNGIFNSEKEDTNEPDRELCPIKTFKIVWRKAYGIRDSYNVEQHTDIVDKNKITNERIQRHVYTQIPRSFNGSSDVDYCKGYILSQPESDGTLAIRCLEFKSFVDCVNNYTERVYFKFLLDTLRFICGCLNSRTNGTIYFGIGDGKNENCIDGEIIGNIIDSNSQKIYSKILEDGILECFDSNVAKIVQKCVPKPPIFVKVKSPGKNESRYVIEVDVEASFKFCKNLVFKVNLYKIFECLHSKQKLDNQNIEDLKKSFKEPNKYVSYVRRGSETKKISDKDIKAFKQRELPDLVVSRIVFEIRDSNLKHSIDDFYEALKQFEVDFPHDSNNVSSVFIRAILESLNGNKEMETCVQVVKKIVSRFTSIDVTIEINKNHQNTNSKDEQNESRSFLGSSDNFKYSKGSTLSQPESEVKRLREFKNFDHCVNNLMKINYFVKEVIKFSNECLNRGIIGTIYFGVTGYKPPKGFKVLEIIGEIIEEIGYDSRTMYTDKLRYAIKKSFYKDTADIALKCISNPQFVIVEILREKRCRYVIEVDVEPLFVFCQNKYFLVNLNFDLDKENNLKRKKIYDIFGVEGLSQEILEKLKKDLKKILNKLSKSNRGVKYSTDNTDNVLVRVTDSDHDDSPRDGMSYRYRYMYFCCFLLLLYIVHYF